MGEVVGYSRRDIVPNASVGSGGGGGDMDDILQRLGAVEESVSELRTQVSAISATIPHLATKADVAEIPHLATKADVAEVKADVASVRVEVAAVKADVAAVETAIIKWTIATVLASAALAFAIAKFVH